MTILEKIAQLPDDKSLAAGHGGNLTTTEIKKVAESHKTLLMAVHASKAHTIEVDLYQDLSGAILEAERL